MWQDIIHPITCQCVNRNLAMALIRPVSHEVHQQIYAERLRRGLNMEVHEPLNQEDFDRYHDTVKHGMGRYVHISGMFFIECSFQSLLLTLPVLDIGILTSEKLLMLTYLEMKILSATTAMTTVQMRRVLLMMTF